jgi:ribosomal protein L31E
VVSNPENKLTVPQRKGKTSPLSKIANSVVEEIRQEVVKQTVLELVAFM